MSEVQQDHISKRRVLYELPGVDAVTVRSDIEYQAGEAAVLTMDLYDPPDSKSGARLPAMIIVTGYPDPGCQKILGCRFKEMASSVSWGRLVAASGIVAITYTNQQPAADLRALLRFVRENAAAWGIDESRIGVFAASGSVPLALSTLMGKERELWKCAVFCYGYMLDLDGSTHVADAAKTWGFVNPNAGRSIEDLSRETPLFLVRAGQDQFPHLNETLDAFVMQALARNTPVSLVNHAAAPHAFDLFHDSGETRAIIRWILEFMQFHLLAR